MLKISQLNNINSYNLKKSNLSDNKIYRAQAFSADRYEKPKKKKYLIGNSFNSNSGFVYLKKTYSDSELKRINSTKQLPENFYLVSLYENNEQHKNNNGFRVARLSEKRAKNLSKKGKIVTKTLPDELSLVNYNDKTYVKDNNLVDLKKAKRKQTLNQTLTASGIVAGYLLVINLFRGKGNKSEMGDDCFDLFDFIFLPEFFEFL